MSVRDISGTTAIVTGAKGDAAAPRSAGMTRSATSAKATTLTVMLGLTAAGWIVASREMSGMDMGVATQLGSFTFFFAVWISMMAAMMAAMTLPGATPAALRYAKGRLRALPLFVGSYLVVWAPVGVAAYLVDRPHGTIAAGVTTIAAGVYEFTPLKQHFRLQGHQSVGSGFGFGAYYVGSSIGLMLMLVALGIMSVTWMIVIAVITFGQKLVPANTAIDVPLALAIVGLCLVILIAPLAVPGLTPSM